MRQAVLLGVVLLSLGMLFPSSAWAQSQNVPLTSQCALCNTLSDAAGHALAAAGPYWDAGYADDTIYVFVDGPNTLWFGWVSRPGGTTNEYRVHVEPRVGLGAGGNNDDDDDECDC